MTTKENALPNREYRDRLFRFIFGSNKQFLLSLYNAVNHTHYTNAEDITFTTIEDVLYLNMKNDVSFLFQSTMNLYEHQSTFNPNMPLRSLLYYAQLIQEYIKEYRLNIYDKRLQKIPAPRCYVFYNGDRNEPDMQELYLSDALLDFRHSELDKKIEWTVVMLNVNFGKNQELMKQCQPLEEYARFVVLVKDYAKANPLKDAINKAVDKASGFVNIGRFLQKFRNEVVDMVLTEFNQKEHDEFLREEGREEGILEAYCQMVDNGMIPFSVVVQKTGISEEELSKALETYNKKQ